MMSSLNRSHSLSSNSRIFKCNQLSSNISLKLQSFYQKNEFSDIVLVAAIDNFEVHAHRIILSAASEYFLGMFRSTLKESNANIVELKEVDGVTLKLIIDFMYTATIELRSETVEIISRAADFFQLKTLVAACCDFMTEQVEVSNCLGITLFAEQHQYAALHRESLAFALKNFQQVHTEKEFLLLNEKQLSTLVSSDNLCAESEEIVFLGIVAWVEYDKANREHLMLNLLSHVRFSLLKPQFIIENRHSVSTESYELILSWLEWHSSCSPQPIEHSKSRQQFEKLVYVSIHPAKECNVQSYNPQLKYWVREQGLPSAPLVGLNYKMTAVGTRFILAREFSEYEHLEEIQNVACLDTITNSWTDLPPMALVRTSAGIAELNGYLYFVGGRTKLNWSHAVDRYDFALGEWQNVASLPLQPQPVQVVVVDNLLYAVSNDQMGCYNPDTDRWTLKQFKNEKLVDFSIAGVNGYLYAVGGTCNGATSNIVERYDPTKNTWTIVGSLRVGFANLLCTAFNNRLIACWGFDGETRINLVQAYDPDTDEWRTLAPLLLDMDMDVECSSLFTLKS